MNTAILFGIWLNRETYIYKDAYSMNDSLYYVDSSTDMEKLFKLFLESDFFRNS